MENVDVLDTKLSPHHVDTNGSSTKQDTTTSESRPRTHTQIMEQLGYGTYIPPVKKAKNTWEMLLEQFPCPPEYQHKVWAARIHRQFKQDCGLPYFWECECMKCEATTASEICTYEGAIALSMLNTLSTVQSPLFATDEEGMNPLDFRAVCSGVDEVEAAGSYRTNSPFGNVSPVVLFGYVHLFTELADVNPVDGGPRTPFMTTVNVDEIPDGPLPPRIMWVRAKAVTPTYLSFR